MGFITIFNHHLGELFLELFPKHRTCNCKRFIIFIKFKNQYTSSIDPKEHGNVSAISAISTVRPMDPTVDGRNPAPVDRKFIPLLKGCFASQVVSRISSINSMWSVFLLFVRRLQCGNRGVSEPPFDCLGHRRFRTTSRSRGLGGKGVGPRNVFSNGYE